MKKSQNLVLKIYVKLDKNSPKYFYYEDTNIKCTTNEILNLFSRELDDRDFIAIKRLIVKYLGEKITKLTDEVWEQKGWTNEDMKALLKTHKRTPYNPKN